VRKVEELVTNSKNAPKLERSSTNKYESQRILLEEKLGKKVKISSKQLTISFKNEDELNQILSLLC
jgi:hypothetical protein